MAAGSERKSIMRWVPVLAAMIIPGSGHVILGKPLRGMLMVFWMIVFGFITFQISGENISFIGKFAGGFAVWVLSVLEVYRIAK